MNRARATPSVPRPPPPRSFCFTWTRACNMKPSMKFAFSSEETVKVRADVLAAPGFDGELEKERVVVALDKALGGLVSRLIEEERFKGKKGQTLAFITHGKIPAARVALIGAGSRKDFVPSDMRPL